jgi:hypothetical protein
MDLGTVKQKLQSQTYTKPSEFAADVRLVLPLHPKPHPQPTTLNPLSPARRPSAALCSQAFRTFSGSAPRWLHPVCPEVRKRACRCRDEAEDVGESMMRAEKRGVCGCCGCVGLRQTFDNAMLFNPQGNYAHDMAR